MGLYSLGRMGISAAASLLYAVSLSTLNLSDKKPGWRAVCKGDSPPRYWM